MPERLGIPIEEIVPEAAVVEKENPEHGKVLAYLKNKGILTMTSNYSVIDTALLEQTLQHDSNPRVDQGYINKIKLISVLKGLSGYTVEDIQTEQFKTGELRPRKVVSLPGSLEELELGRDNSGQLNTAILKPWDIGRNTNWSREVVLDSGEKINLAELAIAEKLHDLQAKRDPENGQLMIKDPQTGEYQKFNNQLFRRLTGLNPTISAGKDLRHRRTWSFEGEPGVFLKYLPRLQKLGVLRASDIKRVAGSPAERIYNVPERTVDNNGFVSISSSQGFARYYIGKGKFLKKIPIENIVVRRLTQSSAGIFDKTHGGEKLIYLLDLASPAEIAEAQKGLTDLPKTNRSARTTFDRKFTQSHLRPYIAQEFIARHEDETDDQYEQRKTFLHDPNFVVKQCAELFSEAGIGIHNLPWSEQIVLAGAILEEHQRDKIVAFAKQFGLEGVRSLLSLDYDRTMGKAIFEIAEKLKTEDAKRIFQKYNAIVDISYKAADYVLKSLPNASQPQSETVLRIQDNLLRKAKNLVQSYHVKFADKLADSTEIEKQLDKCNEEALLFASTFRTLIDEGEHMESFSGLDTEEISGPQLSKQDTENMRSIYETNWASKTTPDYWQFLNNKFLTSTENLAAKFRILRHDGKIIAFTRFISERPDIGNPYVHAGAFNVGSSYQNGKIGEIFLNQALQQQIETGFEIHAETNPTNPMLRKYLAMGFRKVGENVELGEPEVKLMIPARPVELKLAA